MFNLPRAHSMHTHDPRPHGQFRKLTRANVFGSTTLLVALLSAAFQPAKAAEIAQIIIGPGSVGISQGFLLPNAQNLPPFAAFRADIATAGPSTSSGLLFYQTPGLTWSCQGTSCGAQGRFERFTLETCIALAAKVGPILTLSAAGQHAADSDIKSCNEIASGGAGQQNGTISAPGSNSQPTIRIAPPGQ